MRLFDARKRIFIRQDDPSRFSAFVGTAIKPFAVRIERTLALAHLIGKQHEKRVGHVDRAPGRRLQRNSVRGRLELDLVCRTPDPCTTTTAVHRLPNRLEVLLLRKSERANLNNGYRLNRQLCRELSIRAHNPQQFLGQHFQEELDQPSSAWFLPLRHTLPERSQGHSNEGSCALQNSAIAFEGIVQNPMVKPIQVVAQSLRSTPTLQPHLQSSPDEVP